MTTAKLTTGRINATFVATGEQVLILVHDLATNGVEREVVDLAAGRKQFAYFRKIGAVKGATRPTIRLRRITTDAQFGAWAKQAFDLENDDNAPESMMVSEEIFCGQGFLEVAA